MKEIEMKLQVKGLTYEDLKRKMKKYISSDEKYQEDEILLSKEQIGKPIVSGSRVYRIRTVKTKDAVRHLFTLKVQTDKALISDEYELEISDPVIAKDAMLASGLVERVRVAKKRVEGEVNEFNLCIDEVEGLGVFIELEAFSDDNFEIIQDKMLNTLKSLDIEGEICRIPYDSQLEQLQRR